MILELRFTFVLMTKMQSVTKFCLFKQNLKKDYSNKNG